jgi:hypothetical protein
MGADVPPVNIGVEALLLEDEDALPEAEDQVQLIACQLIKPQPEPPQAHGRAWRAERQDAIYDFLDFVISR